MGAYEYPSDPVTIPEMTTSETRSVTFDAFNTEYRIQVENPNNEIIQYQWYQNRNDGLGYVAISNGGIFSGVQTDSLSITEPGVELEGIQFRVEVIHDQWKKIVDAGSLHVPIRPIFVDHHATGDASGRNWDDAFVDLGDAIEAAEPFTRIFVAQGTYKPDSGDNQNASWWLPANVEIYGGFAGTESNLAERDFRSNPTVLSGNIGSAASAEDDSFSLFYNDSQQLIRRFGKLENKVTDETSVLDGFTLTRAAQSAVVNINGNPSIRNCIFTGNHGIAGAGIRHSMGNSKMLVEACEFKENRGGQGAGVFAESDISLINCLFHNNTVTFQGAAIALYGVKECKIIHCTIANNNAYHYGGIYSYGAQTEIHNSILWNNRDPIAFQNDETGTSLKSAQFHHEVGDPQYTDQPGYISLNHSLSEGLGETDANGNSGFDPLFVDDVNADFSLRQISPAINEGVNIVDPVITTDFTGAQRPNGVLPDIGAKEFTDTPQTPVKVLEDLRVLDVFESFDGQLTIVGTSDPLESLNWIWEVKEAGQSTWVGIIDNETYDISQSEGSSTLTLNQVSNGLNGNSYRARLENTDFVSVERELNVQPIPILYVDAAMGVSGNGQTWGTAFATVQEALAQWEFPSEIWVKDGNYTGVSGFLKPGMKIYGGFDGGETELGQRTISPQNCVLNADAENPILSSYLSGNEGIKKSTIIDGFTFSSCEAIGSIALREASPSISNCRFVNNNRFGISIFSSSPSITDCLFSGNGESALYVSESSPKILKCEFTGNRDQNFAGGITALSSIFSISQCEFDNNQGNFGGALYFRESEIDISRCEFSNNRAHYGASLEFSNSEVRLNNVLVHSNYSETESAGIRTTDGTLVMNHCTVVENVSSAIAGGVLFEGEGVIDMVNSIVWGNKAFALDPAELETAQIINNGPQISVSYSIIQGVNKFNGLGNIDADPLFADSGNHDFSLTPYSPGVNTGDPARSITIATDLTGYTRIQGSSVDIGAFELSGVTEVSTAEVLSYPSSKIVCQGDITFFEFESVSGGAVTWQVKNELNVFENAVNDATYNIVHSATGSRLTVNTAQMSVGVEQFQVLHSNRILPAFNLTLQSGDVIYVDTNAGAGLNNGTTWANAYTELSEALENGAHCSEIWMAQGEYSPAVGSSFYINKGIRIYGGFLGTEQQRNERNVAGNETLLKSADGSELPLVVIESLDAGQLPLAILDRISFQSSKVCLDINNASPLIQDCRFYPGEDHGILVRNSADPHIKGVTIDGRKKSSIVISAYSAPDIEDSHFLNNVADNGGALKFEANSQAKVVGSVFEANNASFGGGAVFISEVTSALIDRCIFKGNSATTNGAAILVNDSSDSVKIVNSLFHSNSAKRGGAIASFGNRLEILNGTITQNLADELGGGIYAPSGIIKVDNSILWANQSLDSFQSQEAMQIYGLRGLITVNHTLLDGADSFESDTVVDNAPLFINPILKLFELSASSPAIGAAEGTLLTDYPLDLSNASRLVGPEIDLGAYEFTGVSGTAVHVLESPSSVSVRVGGEALFKVTTLNAGDEFMWQQNDGSGWQSVVESATISTYPTKSGSLLLLQNISQNLNQYRFRVLINGVALDSSIATLTVSASPSNVLYVNSSVANEGNGASWGTAFKSISAALNVASKGTQVWVASGNYKAVGGGNQESVHSMKPGVVLLGGFNGSENSSDHRNPQTNMTIISPMEGLPAFRNEGSSGVMDQSTVIDGFYFEGAEDTAMMINFNASPTIRQCVFRQNSQASIWNINASPVIVACEFSNNQETPVVNTRSQLLVQNSKFLNNTSTQNGGAILAHQSELNVYQSEFDGNSAASHGGAVFMDEHSCIQSERTLFKNNRAGANGGALYSGNYSSYSFANCVLGKNEAGTEGGAIWSQEEQSSLINCTVAGNVALSQGASLVHRDGVLKVYNSILYYNTVPSRGNHAGVESDQLFGDEENFDIKFSNVEGLSKFVGNDNISNIPLFVDFLNSDFRLKGYSPSVNAGNNALVTSNFNLDMGGNSRLFESTVDLGAHEYGLVKPGNLILSSIPGNLNVCKGSDAVFSLDWQNLNLTIQWEVEVDGEFVPVTSDDISYRISTTDNKSVLEVLNVPLSFHGVKYRYRFSELGFVSPSFSLQVIAPSVIYVDAAIEAPGDGSSWGQALNSIYKALELADACTEVWVAQGVYNVFNDQLESASLQLDDGVRVYGGFAVGDTDLSQRDWTAQPSIIQSDFQDRVFDNLGSASTGVQSGSLDGFQIKHLNGGYGILNVSDRIVIRNCLFQDFLSAPILNLRGSDLLLSNCSFLNNESSVGTIYSSASSLNVIECLFDSNHSENSGAAIHLRNSTGIITDTNFKNNSTEIDGGAVFAAANSVLDLFQCEIEGNKAEGSGGGIYLSVSSKGDFENSLFYLNTADFSGGGIYSQSLQVELENMTFFGNKARYEGGGIYHSDGAIKILNSILWNNRITFYPEEQSVDEMQIFDASQNLNLQNTTVEKLDQLSFTGTNNDGIQPLFANVVNRDFRLTPYSSSIDSGVNTSTPPQKDLDGNDRVINGVIDRGAYEYQTNSEQALSFIDFPSSLTVCEGSDAVFYVSWLGEDSVNLDWLTIIEGTADFRVINPGDPLFSVVVNPLNSTLTISNVSTELDGVVFKMFDSVSGYTSPELKLNIVGPEIIYVKAGAPANGSGTSWSDPLNNIHDAITKGDSCSEIWVAEGVYTPHPDGLAGVSLVSGLEIYGGFIGNETERIQRDWANNLTIIQNGETRSVLYNDGLNTPIDSSAIMDGFIFQGGQNTRHVSASPTYRNCNFNDYTDLALSIEQSSSPIFRDCQFTGNLDGAVYVIGQSSPEFYDCSFIGNQSTGSGAAVNVGDSSVQFTDCRFEGNQASTGGALSVHRGQQIQITNCHFIQNSSGDGGALYLGFNEEVNILNSVFFQNESTHEGGGIWQLGGQLLIRNSHFVSNTALNRGGGLYLHDGDTELHNSILWNNDTTSEIVGLEDAQLDVFSANTSIKHCLIQGLDQFSGNQNIGYDPLFENLDGGDLRLSVHSPAINQGGNEFIAGVNDDILGDLRIKNTTVDLGAYESQHTRFGIVEIGSQPESVVQCEGETVVFRVTGNITDSMLIQWNYRSPSSSGVISFNNQRQEWIGPVSNGEPVGFHQIERGEGFTELTVSRLTQEMDGYEYFVQLSFPNAIWVTESATVSVFIPDPIYVDVNSPGGSSGAQYDGNSWLTAFKDLQSALDQTESCRPEIWIADGIYYADDGNDFGDLDSIDIPDGIRIYGGFSGNEVAVDQRDMSANPTLFSGLPRSGATEEKASYVFVLSGNETLEDTRTVLNGITIENGINGVLVDQGRPHLQFITVRNNDSTGILLNNTAAFVSNAEIYSNGLRNGVEGTGVYIQSGKPVIQNSVISGNSGITGGGIYTSGSNTTVVNSLLSGNYSSQGGGAIHVNGTELTLMNSTISGNRNDLGFGAGLYFFSGTLRMNNSILWANQFLESNDEKLQIFSWSRPEHLRVEDSLIEGTDPAVQSHLNGYQNNSFDPNFITALDPALSPHPGGDFNLQPCSPAINAGENTFWKWSGGSPQNGNLVDIWDWLDESFDPNPFTTDLNGRDRFFTSGQVDVGAYEVQEPLIESTYFTGRLGELSLCAGADGSISLTLNSQGGTFQWQVDLVGGDSVFEDLADDGTYIGTDSSTLEIKSVPLGANGNRYRCVYTNLSGCSVVSNTTTLQVNMTRLYVNWKATGLANGASWLNAFTQLEQAIDASKQSECEVEIWVASGIYTPTETDSRSDYWSLRSGLSIYGGFAGEEVNRSERDWSQNRTILSGDIGKPFDSSDNSFYLFRNFGSSTEVDHTAILDGFTLNNASYGLYNQNDAAPSVLNCTFENFSNNAAIHLGSSFPAVNKTPIYKNCIFQNNGKGVFSGTAITSGRNPLYVENCIFRGNYSGFGGAVYLSEGASGTIANFVNCLFHGNVSKFHGGAIYCSANNLQLINSTVASNYAMLSEGGISARGNFGTPKMDSFVFLYNSILWGNLGNGVGGETEQVKNAEPDNLWVSNSIIEDFSYPGGFLKNSNENPGFKNAIVAGSVPSTNGDYQLLDCSPGVNGGSDDQLYWLIGNQSILNDLSGGDRKWNGSQIDIGPFEMQHAYFNATMLSQNVQVPISGSGFIEVQTSQAATSYRWQVGDTTDLNNVDAIQFSDLTQNATYGGINTSKLIITNPGYDLNHYIYRCLVVSQEGCEAISDLAQLEVVTDNLAPVLASIAVQTVAEGVELSITLLATDGNDPQDTLQFHLEEEPEGATITSEGLFKWTPGELDGGNNYSFNVFVTDDGFGQLSDSQVMTVQVAESNIAPVLSNISNKTVNEGELLEFTGSGTDSDIPVQTLQFSLENAPIGASISSDGNFSWTPTEAEGGSDYSFDVIVTDNGTPNKEDRQEVTVTVNKTNQAPIVSDFVVNTTLGGTVSFDILDHVHDTDLPQQTVTVVTVNDPAHGSIGLVDSTVTYENDGSLQSSDSFTFIVSDGEDQQQGTVTVHFDGVFEVTTADSGSFSTLLEGSLAKAVNDANQYEGQATVMFASSLAGKTFQVGNTYLTDNGYAGLEITGDLKIIGDATKGITIGRPTTRPNSHHFEVKPGAKLWLENINLRDASNTGESDFENGGIGEPAFGGSVYNAGELNIRNSAFFNNTVQGGSGLGADSNADGFGGAIFNKGGIVSVVNSTFSDNSALKGKVVFSLSSGGTGVGGAIYSVNGSVILDHVTIANSSQDTAAVHLLGDASTATASVYNSIISHSSSGTDFQAETVNSGLLSISGDGNLITAHSGFTGTIVNNADPQFISGLIEVNGGPTRTLALQSSSPAADSAVASNQTHDQRGFERSQQDIGAYEVDTTANVSPVLADRTGDQINLATISEDHGSVVFNVTQILGDSLSDGNSPSKQGIGITFLSGLGTWEFRLENDSSWTEVGVVSESKALLLRSVDELRYSPNRVSGETALLNIVGWDSTSGTSGTKVDVSTRGDATAFSSFIDGLQITVEDVNDSPVVEPYSVEFTALNHRTIAGIAVDNLGDINGDSLDDVVIGRSSSVLIANPYSGEVFRSHSPESAREVLGGADYFYGGRLAALGDVNGDNTSDYAVSHANSSAAGLNYGSVYVYSGANGELLYEFSGRETKDTFGITLAYAGDVNGDGYNDILAGTPQGYHSRKGYVDIYSGKDGTLILHLEGSSNKEFGRGASGIGDVNGDGFDDLAIGEPYADKGSRWFAGAVHFYSGMDGTLISTQFGTNQSALLGGLIKRGGDANGDGIPDLIALAEGRPSVYVFSGSDLTRIYQVRNGSLDYRSSISFAGDFNQDGNEDFMAGDQFYTPDGINARGKVWLYSGIDGALLWEKTGEGTQLGFGQALVNVGDTTGDNIDELFIHNFYSATTFGVFTRALPAHESNEGSSIVINLSDVISDHVELVDASDTAGIAIMVLTGQGTWEYDSGSGYISVTGLSEASGLLLTSQDKLRYTSAFPEIASFTIVGWDQTQGVKGERVAMINRGGTAAFSSDFYEISIQVNKINDAPILTPKAPVLDPIGKYQPSDPIMVKNLMNGSVTDPDNDTDFGVAITGSGGSGSWEYRQPGDLEGTWTTWSHVDVRENHALLLGKNDLIRFNPQDTVPVNAFIDFVAWDYFNQYSPGSFQNASIRGGATSYSIANDRATMVIDDRKRIPVISWAKPTDIVYGNLLSNLQLNATADIAGQFFYEPSIGTALNAGINQVLRVTFVPQNSATYSDAVLTVNLDVLPKPMDVNVDDLQKVYGQMNPPFTVSSTGLVGGDTLDPIYSSINYDCEADENSVAGVYTISARDGVLPNYEINFVDGQLEVMKAPLRIVSEARTKVYGAVLPGLSYQISGYVNGDDNSSLDALPIIGTTATSSSPVGMYTISTSGGVAQNYEMVHLGNLLKVLPAVLTVNVQDQQKIYGEPLPPLGVNISGLVNGDSVNDALGNLQVYVAADSKSNVGNYSIQARGIPGSNYQPIVTPGTLTIHPANLKIIADSKQKQYGAPLPELTARFEGFKNNQDSSVLTAPFVISTTATQLSNVGDYTIHVSGGAAPNYQMTHQTGLLNVLPSELKVRATDQFISAGDELPALTADISGLVNGDLEENLALNMELTTTAADNSGEGVYPIQVTGNSPVNYSVEYVDGRLWVLANISTLIVRDENISISGATGISGVYKVGDVLSVQWNNTAEGDNNSQAISKVTVDFSEFGGGAAVAASNLNGTWTAQFAIAEDNGGSIDGTNLNVSVTVTDVEDSVVTTVDSSNATLDNDSPIISSANISISGATGTNGIYKTGDTVLVTWDNSVAGDNNADTISSVFVDFTQFGGNSNIVANNNGDQWTASFLLNEKGGGVIDGTSFNVNLSVRDDAGNTAAIAATNNVSIDNSSPVVTDGNIEITGGTGIGGIFRVGDTATVTWDNSSSGDHNLDLDSVFVNFTEFGGQASVQANQNANIWSATFTIPADGGGLTDGSALNVSVKAVDDAGNVTTTADTSNSRVVIPAPGGIGSGMTLWLKADSGVFSDAGSTAAVSGGAVQEWQDLSGNKNHVNQATAGLRPTLKDAPATQGFNFNPALSFSNANMNRASLLASNSNGTVFAVVQSSNLGADNTIIEFEDAKPSVSLNHTQPGLRISHADSNPNAATHQLPVVAVDTAYLTGVRWNNGIDQGVATRLNGKQEIVPNFDVNGDVGARIDIGATGSQSNPLQGEVAELIVYNGNISNANHLNQIESYLALKYGITIDQTNPQNYVDSKGNKIWDTAIVGSNFNQNIAGIGHDDGSNLRQLKSKSIHANAIVTITKAGQGMVDGEFLLWGNNGAALSFSDVDVPGCVDQRLAREWVVEETGEIGSIDVSFDLTGIALPVGVGIASDFYLLTDADGTFSSDAAYRAATSFSDNVVIFEGVKPGKLNDGIYFSLGADVNENPVGVNDIWKRKAGTGLIKIFVPELLSNDTDPDCDRLILVEDQLPATSINGSTISLLPGGRWILYTPAEAAPATDDTFTYQLSDSRGGTATSMVTIDVDTPNTPTKNNVSAVVNGNDLDLKFRGIPGRKYKVQFTLSLVEPITWVDASGPLTAGNRGQLDYTDLNVAAQNGSRFYRTVEYHE